MWADSSSSASERGIEVHVSQLVAYSQLSAVTLALFATSPTVIYKQ